MHDPIESQDLNRTDAPADEPQVWEIGLPTRPIEFDRLRAALREVGLEEAADRSPSEDAFWITDGHVRVQARRTER